MMPRSFAFCAALLLVCAGTSAAQTVKLDFVNGQVTLITQNAPVSAILAEWARRGGTRIVNGERVPGVPLTLELRDVSERQALDIILRGVAGYMIAAREIPGSGPSRIDRVMILPTSTAPRPTTTPTTFATPQPNAGVRPVVRPPLVDIDDDIDTDVDDPITAGPPRPGVPPPPPAAQPGFVRPVINGQPFQQPPPQQEAPVQPTPAVGQPRVPTNPFTALPGSSRPGEVTPAPPQQPDRLPNQPVPSDR
jgi:hypothetical protein